jgi:beta-ureidopropionase / N-carbamoyl-L-amino-acid hydrolase
MNLKDLRINDTRLQETLETMAKIGGTPAGGVQRTTVTDLDKEGRDLLVKWYREAGCEITIDRMGNTFGRRPGKNRDLPCVITGSHADTQPKGGRFDGILGVLSGLEVMRTINENKIELERDFVIVNWTNEEGGTFAPACMGSGVWAGKLDIEWAYARQDKEGHLFGEELERIGYKGDAPCEPFPIHAAYEYHIEQGPVLERVGKTIGAPKGILCLHWYDIYLEGTANQVGPTPMEGRNDALVAFSEMCLTVNKVAHQMGNMVSTVGEIQNYPNSRNIIPDKVHFTVDIRSWDDDHALKAWEMMKSEFQVIASRRGCPIRMEETWKVEHAPFAQSLVDNVIESAEELGYPVHKMVSGAGHDMSYVNQLTDGAMIFIPSKDGRSHVEVEDSTYADCAAGCNVLLHCVLKSGNEQ